MTKRKTTATKADPEKRGRGRPPLPDEKAKRETYQFRASGELQKPWLASAGALKQDKSAWARAGLDAWTLVCDRARELGVNPEELIKTALEDHARVRAAIAELKAARSRSTLDDRLLRILSALEWSRTD